MFRAVNRLLMVWVISSSAWALPAAPATTPANPTAATNTALNNASIAAPSTANPAANASTTTNAKPTLSYEQLQRIKVEQELKIKNLAKAQQVRMNQLEKANLDALSQNQELQLKNDNLLVQIQVLQSERSAQMFLYGAATVGLGVLLGFFIASYIYTKRRRQW